MLKLTAPQLVTLRYIAEHPRAFVGHPGTLRALIDRGLVTEKIIITEAGAAALAAQR